MGFTTGNFPDVDPATFRQRPFMDRIRAVAAHWVDYGFGTPKMVHTIYIVKLLVLYVGVGTALATLASGLSWLDPGSWWNQPIVYQKLVLWTVLIEASGLGGSWGPLAGHFKPMTGGFHNWLKPDTIRLPPWPNRVPFTAGDRRTIFDVVVYAAILLLLIAAIVTPGAHSASVDAAIANNAGLVRPAQIVPIILLLLVLGLRDKVAFLGARSEQYIPAMLFFSILPFVNMIVALKLLIAIVWIGAGVSKFGRHFAMVIPPMISNTPWLTSKRIKRAHYRHFPDDLRHSPVGSTIGHVLGTLVELVTPVVLVLSTSPAVTLAAVILMVCFHLFIASTFPLAVPLEWNLLFAFATVFLFWGFPAWDGYGVLDMSPAWLAPIILVGLLFFPVLGNLRPDLVSFLPSMRQYAGNWASATWAFAPGAEEKLETHIVRSAKNTYTQLLDTYEPEVADVIMHQLVGWRSLHSQGRALLSLMMRQLGDDIDRYDLREAEFSCNSIVAFNFGDGHFHNEDLIAAIQRRCSFAPGEFIVAWIESQPIHKETQEYKVIDAALGVIERGTYLVADAADALPSLPDGPIPFTVTWRRDASAGTQPSVGGAQA